MTEPNDRAGYDVIGDVHGHADELTALLAQMGYRHDDDAWRHPTRTAVFVGDLIDRGPQQRATVEIARAMTEARTAQVVLGNHEFNAIAWHTADPDEPGIHLRPHTPKNDRQHREFLTQVGEGSDLHHEILDWFMTMPLWLDLTGLRVVHACWDPMAMAELADLLGPDQTPTAELVRAASRADDPAHGAVEHLLKGPEVDLPDPYLDKDDNPRHRARFAWWNPAADLLSSAALLPGGVTTLVGDPYPTLPDTAIEPPVPPYRDEVPVLYGHYWETGTPRTSGPRTACVDYSAGKGGPLVAYRWSGETLLDDDNFVSTAHRAEAVRR